MHFSQIWKLIFLFVGIKFLIDLIFQLVDHLITQLLYEKSFQLLVRQNFFNFIKYFRWQMEKREGAHTKLIGVAQMDAQSL